MLPCSLVYGPYRVRSLSLPVQQTSVLPSEVPAGITQIAGTGTPTLSRKASLERRPQSHQICPGSCGLGYTCTNKQESFQTISLKSSHAFTFQLSSMIRKLFYPVTHLNYYNRLSSDSNTLQIVTCLWETRNIKIPTKVHCLGDPYSCRII